MIHKSWYALITISLCTATIFAADNLNVLGDDTSEHGRNRTVRVFKLKNIGGIDMLEMERRVPSSMRKLYEAQKKVATIQSIIDRMYFCLSRLIRLMIRGTSCGEKAKGTYVGAGKGWTKGRVRTV